MRESVLLYAKAREEVIDHLKLTVQFKAAVLDRTQASEVDEFRKLVQTLTDELYPETAKPTFKEDEVKKKAEKLKNFERLDVLKSIKNTGINNGIRRRSISGKT